MIDKLKAAVDKRGITIYRLSKMVDMKYIQLNRVFLKKRKLTAVELLKILDCTGIELEEIR